MSNDAHIETAKEVAGKSIGRYGLGYITGIVLIGVGASAFLPEGHKVIVQKGGSTFKANKQ